jgi:tetratricopeptide (TPR) repeat protein
MTAPDPSAHESAPPGEQLVVRLPGQASDWKEIGLWAGVLALLVLIPFFGATSGSALPRDNDWIQYVRFPGSFSAAWSGKSVINGQPMLKSYEPMAFTAYWLEYRVQPRPAANPADPAQPVTIGFHLGALLLHAAAVVLLWLILRDLRAPGSWMAAAVFALHPVNAEAVSWISSQDVVLAGAFGFGAIYCWMHFARCRDRDTADRAAGGPGVDPAITWSLYAGGVLLALLSVLANPVGVIFPAMALFAIGWRRQLNSFDVLMLVIPGLASVVLWAVVASKSSFNLTTGQILGDTGLGVWTSLRDALVPIRLTSFHPDPASSEFGITIAVLAGLACAGIIAVTRLRMIGVTAGVAGYALAVVFGLNWFDPSRGGVVTDASAYVADAFLFTLIVAGVARLIPPAKQSMSAGLGVAMVILLVLGIGAHVRSGAFADPVAFWADAVAKDGQSTVSHGWLAEELRLRGIDEFNGGQTDDALADLKRSINEASRAVAINASNGRAERTWANALVADANIQNSLKNYKVASGEMQDSLKHYFEAVRLFPRNAGLRIERAKALIALGYYPGALEQLESAVRANPLAPEPHRLEGQVYAATSQPALAIREENLAVSTDPLDWAARQILAEQLVKSGKLDEAKTEYARILGDPAQRKRPELYTAVAAILDREGNYAGEATALGIAATLDSSSARYKSERDAAMRKERAASATRPTSGPATQATTGPFTLPTTVPGR